MALENVNENQICLKSVGKSVNFFGMINITSESF